MNWNSQTFDERSIRLDHPIIIDYIVLPTITRFGPPYSTKPYSGRGRNFGNR